MLNNNLVQKIDDPFLEAEERRDALKYIIENDEQEHQPAYSNVDLHLHSNYSDGYWTPEGLALEAHRKGMDTIALTDHDGFEGIEEMFEAINLIQEITRRKINFIPGVEFSTNYYYEESKKKEVHILGYFPANDYESFLKYTDKISGRNKAHLNTFQRNRTLRIYEMAQKFNTELPKHLPLLDKVRQAQDPIISFITVERGLRRSIAPGRLLASTGIFEIVNLYRRGELDKIEDEKFSLEYLQALDEFIGEIDTPQNVMNTYFDKAKPSAKTGYIGETESPEWAVNIIREMGGIPVLAHPAKYIEHYKDLINKLIPVGLKGVEVFSDRFKDRETLQGVLNYVQSQYSDLLITIGSDCHGNSIDNNVDYTPKNRMGLREDYGVNLKKYEKGAVADLFLA